MSEKFLNKVVVLGRLGRDPEIKFLPSGDQVVNFSVATTESWKGKDGQQQAKTEWHRVVCFGKLAEICGEYLKKGGRVYLEGRLQTREWKADDGSKRSSTEIVMNDLIMLSEKPGGAERPSGTSGGEQAWDENDIPF